MIILEIIYFTEHFVTFRAIFIILFFRVMIDSGAKAAGGVPSTMSFRLQMPVMFVL